MSTGAKITLRLPVDLHAWLAEQASHANRSLNSELIFRLNERRKTQDFLLPAKAVGFHGSNQMSAADTYAGLPVRRGLFTCDDWQRMAEDLLAFQDAVQEALGTQEAGDVLPAISRLFRLSESDPCAGGWRARTVREAVDDSDSESSCSGRPEARWVRKWVCHCGTSHNKPVRS